MPCCSARRCRRARLCWMLIHAAAAAQPRGRARCRSHSSEPEGLRAAAPAPGLPPVPIQDPQILWGWIPPGAERGARHGCALAALLLQLPEPVGALLWGAGSSKPWGEAWGGARFWAGISLGEKIWDCQRQRLHRVRAGRAPSFPPASPPLSPRFSPSPGAEPKQHSALPTHRFPAPIAGAARG